MKRLPLLVSFILFIALCASIAYWATQLFKPPLRPVAAPPRAALEVDTAAAAGLFGGRAGKVAVASNYQLRGVIFAGNEGEGVAILSADGKPAQAVRVEMEVLPGVVVKEVHRQYVLLEENGVVKRVELPESAQGQADLATISPVPSRPAPIPPPPPPPTATPAAPATPAVQPGIPDNPSGIPNTVTGLPQIPQQMQQQIQQQMQQQGQQAPQAQTAPPTAVVNPGQASSAPQPPSPQGPAGSMAWGGQAPAAGATPNAAQSPAPPATPTYPAGGPTPRAQR